MNNFFKFGELTNVNKSPTFSLLRIVEEQHNLTRYTKVAKNAFKFLISFSCVIGKSYKTLRYLT